MKAFFVNRMKSGSLSIDLAVLSSLAYMLAVSLILQMHRGDFKMVLIGYSAVTIPYVFGLFAFLCARLERHAHHQ